MKLVGRLGRELGLTQKRRPFEGRLLQSCRAPVVTSRRSKRTYEAKSCRYGNLSPFQQAQEHSGDELLSWGRSPTWGRVEAGLIPRRRGRQNTSFTCLLNAVITVTCRGRECKYLLVTRRWYSGPKWDGGNEFTQVSFAGCGGAKPRSQMRDLGHAVLWLVRTQVSKARPGPPGVVAGNLFP